MQTGVDRETGKEEKGDGMSLAVLVGALREPEEIAREIKHSTPNIKRLALIGGNTRGYVEIYFELETDAEAEIIAMHFQMIPAPVAGKMMSITFDELVNAQNFKMMGGKVIE
jgi:hypothetical protein